MVIAEERALPAAERMERHRHRDRQVDADHPDPGARREIARRVAVAGEDRGAIAEFMRVDEAKRVFVSRGAYHREHRAKDFLPIDAHLRRDMIEKTAAEEIALLIALERDATAIDHELGAFRQADIDISLHALIGLARHQW